MGQRAQDAYPVPHWYKPRTARNMGAIPMGLMLGGIIVVFAMIAGMLFEPAPTKCGDAPRPAAHGPCVR